MQQQKSFFSNFSGGGIFYKLPLLILIMLSLAVSAFANTHTSTATIAPNIVKASTFYTFTAHVTNLVGPDPVSEFRIYLTTSPPDINDITCLPASGWYGPFVIPGSTGFFCQYTAQTPADYIYPGNSKDFTFTATSPATGSCRIIELETRDPNHYYTPLPVQVCVDVTPPITTKTYAPLAYTNGNSEWISGSTLISLTAVDPEPHPSGVKFTKYLTALRDDIACQDPARCIDDPVEEDARCWNTYTEPFTIPEESCHLIQFYSKDNVNNRETLKWQCVFVDTTPPILTKRVGEPNIPVEDDFNYWVSQETPIYLNCQDTGPHPSNNVTIYWSYTVDGGSPITGSHNGQDYELFFAEDSVHALDAWCTDAVGNTSTHDIETFRVDGTPPIMSKTMLGIEGTDYLGECPPEQETDQCYVADNGRGGVHVSVSDPDPTEQGCNVNNATCTYELWWDSTREECAEAEGKYYPDTGKCLLESDSFGEEGKDILFHQDSTHTLIVNCQDALGNAMSTDTEQFLVDSTGPVTEKTYGTPFYTDGYNDWITTATPITLTATDAKVGVDKTYYRYCMYNPRGTGCSCEGTNFAEYNTPFTITEESQHCIEFYSIDFFGNTEAVNSQLVFVDTSAPELTKTVGNPKVSCDETNPLGCDYYVTQQTPITLNCTDSEPHPVGNVINNYRYRTSNDCENWGDWTEWQSVEGDILFAEDSCHELEYYCEDALGNATPIYNEIDIVDTVGPAITKEIVGPRYGDCPPEEESDVCYTNGVTQISVNAVDQQPHPVGEVSCQWGYTLDEERDVFNGWYNTFPIQFPEETQHNLTIVCSDALGNTTTDNETFYVDKTPPVTTKNYGEPFFAQEGKEWITSNTEISFSVEDAGPHKSGIAGTWYKISLVDDSYCENQQICQEATGTGDFVEYSGQIINIPEQSCHFIEYYSKDNVEKTEAVKKQCVYVDNTPPTPAKTVGEPKDIWTPGLNGDPPSYFYPEETENCWTDTEGSIECWQATVLTPITMDCTDPAPHPVGNEKVCFNVELDGSDKTGQYCGRYGGTMNEGFCCLEGTINDFKFMEDSEHNLKYYCADALGNSNKANVDEEKFKIEGTKFEIPLFQKWNLISVPFKLLNDSPEEVFKETEGVDIVWAYDPAHELCGQDWCVYSPDNQAGNDNLPSVTPGWGYWVLEKNEDTGINQPAEWITIGGSLFQTGPTGPLSKSLVPGWNLIGYYGTNWELYDWGDFSYTCGDAFNFPDSWLYGDKVYESLYSLVDTQQGYPKWSSVWSYVNCGNHLDAWLPLDNCPGIGTNQLLGKMYAGRGYWIEMDIADNYVPATGGDGYCQSWPR